MGRSQVALAGAFMLVLSWMSAHLAFGVVLVMVPIPAETVGPRFYRLNLGIAAGLLAVTLLIEQFFVGPDSSWLWEGPMLPLYAVWGCFVLCVGIVVLAKWGTGRLWLQMILLLGATAAVAGLAMEAQRFAREVSQVPWAATAYFLGLASSVFLLGAVLVAMNLGHWYLVVLDMPFRYFRRFSILFGLSIVLKLVALMISLLIFGRQFPEVIHSTATDFITGNALFFWARIAIGLIVPGVLGVMVWQTVKIRSNQSATGLLYVAMVFVLFGELFAKYLLAISHLPL